MAQPAPPRAGTSRKRADDPALGKVIAGRYRLEARIGEGGMGIVYRARHVLIDRVVAVKLIRPDLRGETHLRAWMLREARAANRVDAQSRPVTCLRPRRPMCPRLLPDR